MSSPASVPPAVPASRLRWMLHLTRVLAKRSLRTRYRQSLLDIGWAFLLPVATVAVYGTVLTRLGVPTGCAPYWISAWTGIVLWTFFAESVSGGANSLVTSAHLLTKVYFPREAIPLAVVAAGLVDLAVGMGTVLVIMPFVGVSFTWAALGAVVPLLVIAVWAAALATMTAALAAFIRDVPHAVRLLLQVGFFATPIVYEVGAIPSLRWTATVVPLSAAITEARGALLCGVPIDVPLMAVHLAIGVTALVAACAYVRAIEARIADVV